MVDDASVEIGDLLNAQCGRVRWHEIERLFARGSVITVAPDLDLIDVGRQIVADNEPLISDWLRRGLIGQASTADAKRWQAGEDEDLWAVVCAPWVLVQERHPPPQPE